MYVYMLDDIYIPETLDVQIIQHCDINTGLHNDQRWHVAKIETDIADR